MTLLLLNFLLFLFPAPSAPKVSLHVEVTNVKKNKGKIWLAVYRPDEKFGSDKPELYKVIPVQSVSEHSATFELAPGRYALAVYHDVNNNSVLDKNLVGIPKEPYGFSKDFRPKFSAPSFEDCAFDVGSEGQTLRVKLTN